MSGKDMTAPPAKRPRPANPVDGWFGPATEVEMDDMLKLPLEGKPVEKVVICGNGKDSELILTAGEDSLPAYRIPVRDPSIGVEIEGKVRTEIFHRGDPYLGVRYLPQEPLVFDTCRIEEIPDDSPYLKEALENVNFRGEIEIGWMIREAEIRISTGGSPPIRPLREKLRGE